MKARDIMTKSVVSVRPEATVHEVALLMTEKHVSGVPVIDADNKLVGIISQGDLLHRRELGTEPKHKWWLNLFANPDSMAREYTKTHGLRARDVMSRHITSVNEDAELADVAAVLDRGNIKRVTVLNNGTLVGIIARSDLVKALSRVPPTPHKTSVDSGTLHRTLTDKLRRQPWLETSFLNVVVTDGTVRLWGYVATPDQRRALHALIEQTEGVAGIEDNLSIGHPTMGAV
ncbi:MAG: CBS domain-containing protein [Hyphomicrobiaceae bacterium]